MIASGADVIIVGAGSSGCVVAERLSRDPRRSVLVLEAGGGPPDRQSLRLSHLPIGAGSGRAVHYPSAQGFDLPRGRGVGGSSAVNGGYFVRWHQRDFDGWSTEHWSASDIAATYDRLDGGEAGGGIMNASAFADDELEPTAVAFEKHWNDEGFGRSPTPWPAEGVVRVRSNRDGWYRRSAADILQPILIQRPNLQVMTGSEAVGVRTRGGRAVGVAVGERVLTADEVILCAGTLGTAELLARSDLLDLDQSRIWEHRERLVRFAPAAVRHEPARALLQTVLQTADGIELRCYNDDFASFIDGLTPSSQAFGVALMHPERSGSLLWDPISRLRVDLGEISPSDADKLGAWAARMVAMLQGPRFEQLVEPGTVAVESVVRTSQHAWGTMPMGAATDWLGAARAVPGLRIVDASILPSAGSSGPHATVMMVASRIADRIA
ncbi:mycofactocin system GMC family oxidoreductase MftG [Williamsia sp. 1135]|uniref:mycofactocin system GMC family oxidoreductase MftG n=1 Tax=Williamsia sp. 1135 TaxID=1889262 RepID=UPI000A11BE66|nr:mycofactocin system GMC family oxidoreductase MftG [Williamsia sp. 1135]ORM24995.1 mycofactocin system GMC family oxidoreductase MftG [Williamsia sp. 1135]